MGLSPSGGLTTVCKAQHFPPSLQLTGVERLADVSWETLTAGFIVVIRIMTAFYKVNKDGKRVEPNFSSWVRPNVTFGPVYHKSPGAPIVEVNKHVNVQSDHADLIREMAAKSAVLLKNENGALPLRSPKT